MYVFTILRSRFKGNSRVFKTTASPLATPDGVALVESYWCLFQALSNLGEGFFFLLQFFGPLTKQVSGLGLLVEGNA